ncbi:MAG: hypothetical protein ABIM98_02880 [candidate division WOR-3 bacterium]
MKIILHGNYPRSEKLVEATRDFERGRIKEEELKKYFKEDILNIIKLQKNWDYIFNGHFYFQDLLRPFSELVYEVEIDGLKRFYETNFFMRKLIFKKFEIKENKKFFEHYLLCDGLFNKKENLTFTFPFLFFFQEFSENIKLKEIGELLLKVVKKLNEWGNKLLIFYEPTFGFKNINEEEKEISLWFLKELKKFKNLKFALHSFFFDVSNDLDFIFSLDFDGYGFDFYNNSRDFILKNFPENKLLLAGIINTDSTLIEKKEFIEEFIEKSINYVKEENIYVTTNWSPEFLPREIMDKKIKNLIKGEN